MNQKAMEEFLCEFLSPIETDSATISRLVHLPASQWEKILEFADRYAVTPLLCWRFKSLNLDTLIPSGIWKKLLEAYNFNVSRNANIYHQLNVVLRTLKSEGIEVIVLKGAYLAETIYGHLGLRTMGDVDLLVRKDDLLKAAKKLLELGYTSSSPLLEDITDTARHHLPVFSKPNALAIELHWLLIAPMDLGRRMTTPFCVDIPGLWERAGSAVIADVQVRALCPEDVLLYLCMHNCFERFHSGLRVLCDISETIRSFGKELNWKLFQSRSFQWRAGGCAYLTLRLAKELLQAAVPNDVLKALKPSKHASLMANSAKELIFTRQNNNIPEPYKLVSVKKASRLLEKVAVFLEIVFPTPYVMSAMYPVSPSSIRVYLYYLVRLKDLFLKYRYVLWRLLCRDKNVISVEGRENRANILWDWMISS